MGHKIFTVSYILQMKEQLVISNGSHKLDYWIYSPETMKCPMCSQNILQFNIIIFLILCPKVWACIVYTSARWVFDF